MHDRETTGSIEPSAERGVADLAIDLFPLGMAMVLMLVVYLRVTD